MNIRPGKYMVGSELYTYTVKYAMDMLFSTCLTSLFRGWELQLNYRYRRRTLITAVEIFKTQVRHPAKRWHSQYKVEVHSLLTGREEMDKVTIVRSRERCMYWGVMLQCLELWLEFFAVKNCNTFNCQHKCSSIGSIVHLWLNLHAKISRILFV